MVNVTYCELAPAGAIRAGDMVCQPAKSGLVASALCTAKRLMIMLNNVDGKVSRYFAELATARNHAGRSVEGF